MPDVCLNQEKFLPSKHPSPPSHLALPTASSPPDCSPRQVHIPPLSEPSRFWTDVKINHGHIGQCPLDTGCVTQAIGVHWHNVIEPLFEVNTPLPLVLTMHKSKLALVAEFLLVQKSCKVGENAPPAPALADADCSLSRHVGSGWQAQKLIGIGKKNSQTSFDFLKWQDRDRKQHCSVWKKSKFLFPPTPSSSSAELQLSLTGSSCYLFKQPAVATALRLLSSLVRLSKQGSTLVWSCQKGFWYKALNWYNPAHTKHHTHRLYQVHQWKRGENIERYILKSD